MVLSSVWVAWIASVSVQFWNKEREPKTAQKRGKKEQGAGGEERKETLAGKTQDFEKRPFGLSGLIVPTNI